MRRLLALSCLLALTLVGMPAGADEPEPVIDAVTLHLHGGEQIGEQEISPTGSFRTMDRSAPTGSEAKSVFVTNYVVGPNTDCDGSPLLPTWQDFGLRGTATGDLTVSIPTLALPGSQVVVSLYTSPGGTCSFQGELAPRPVLQQTVTPPAGQGVMEVTFDDVDFSLRGLILMLHVPTTSPGQTRVFYDSTGSDATVAFDCVVPAGRETCG
jgi:hypothetical protein